MANQMLKRYLVTGNWWDKKKNTPVSGIAEINGGINGNGKSWETTDTESYNEPIDGTYPVGTILTATVTLNLQSDTGKAPQGQGMKINQ